MAQAKAANEAVANGAVTHTITHNLSSSGAILRTATVNWATHVFIISKAANTITVGFSVPNVGGGLLDWVAEV